MISTLSSLMIKFGIERVYGKGHHKSVYQKALEKLEGEYIVGIDVSSERSPSLPSLRL